MSHDAGVRSGGRPRSVSVDTAILRAALELFAEVGLQGMSYEKLARRSGVSRSAIHRRWDSLDEIAAAALGRARAVAEQATPDWFDLPYSDAIGWMIEHLPRAMLDKANLNLLRQAASLGSHGETFRQSYWANVLVPRRQAFSQMIEAARLNGFLPSGPNPELLQDILTGALTYRLLFNAEKVDEDDIRQFLVETLRILNLLPVGDNTAGGQGGV